MLEQIGNGHARSDANALQNSTGTEDRTFNGDFAVKPGRSGNDMGQLFYFCCKLLPIIDAIGGIALQNADVSGGAEQAGLQCGLKAIVYGKSDDEGHDACRHAENGNDSDYGNDGLLALGPQVAQRDNPFKTFHL